MGRKQRQATSSNGVPSFLLLGGSGDALKPRKNTRKNNQKNNPILLDVLFDRWNYLRKLTQSQFTNHKTKKKYEIQIRH
jgi:hypothetical protein